MLEAYSFGKIVADGITYNDDIKIIQGKVFPGWRRNQGHSVESDDIRDVLNAAPDILILGKGNPGRMRASPVLREFLRKSGIELIEESTPEAVHIFNYLLKEGKNIAAGFHLTC